MLATIQLRPSCGPTIGEIAVELQQVYIGISTVCTLHLPSVIITVTISVGTMSTIVSTVDTTIVKLLLFSTRESLRTLNMKHQSG